MFKIKFLPARFGDSIWIEYGSGDKLNHILIDGGTGGTRHDIKAELAALPVDQRRLELLVVSHIDRDHIEGVLKLLEEEPKDLAINDFWFNGWPHLVEDPLDVSFGAVQGERLTARILGMEIPWNKSFDGESVVVTDTGPLPEIHLPGGMKLTLLSPTRRALTRLKPKWEQEVREANLDPGIDFGLSDEQLLDPFESYGTVDLPDIETLAESNFSGDRSEANASSIAFLAEFDGRRVLLAADAHAGDLVNAIDRLSPNQKIDLDLFKISHHGSKGTTSRELIERVNCPAYVFTTNGSIFKHPDHETIARVIKSGGANPELIFNYRVTRNEIWALDSLQQQYGYHTKYPDPGTQGIEVSLA